MTNHAKAIEAAHLVDRLERLSRGGVVVRGLNPAQWEALRYLARANRFSRTPAALSDYLGSTRGTVSQTLIALEQKGFVTRQRGTKDRRSIDLDLTASGALTLADDPILGLADDIEAETGDPIELVETLRAVLRRAITRNGGRPFGACHTCRHFQRDAVGQDAHRCRLLGEPLSEGDSHNICVEQEDA